MHYEPEPTLPTTDDPTSASLELSMPPCSSSTVENNNSQEDGTSVEDQPWLLEQRELSRCWEFARITCGCTKAKGKPCSTLFNEEHYADLRAQASFLTREQLDLVILGLIMATVNTEEFRPSYTRHKPAKRQRKVTTYKHHSHHLCNATYNLLHGVGNHRVKAIVSRATSVMAFQYAHTETIREYHTILWCTDNFLTWSSSSRTTLSSTPSFCQAEYLNSSETIWNYFHHLLARR